MRPAGGMLRCAHARLRSFGGPAVPASCSPCRQGTSPWCLPGHYTLFAAGSLRDWPDPAVSLQLGRPWSACALPSAALAPAVLLLDGAGRAWRLTGAVLAAAQSRWWRGVSLDCGLVAAGGDLVLLQEAGWAALAWRVSLTASLLTSPSARPCPCQPSALRLPCCVSWSQP